VNRRQASFVSEIQDSRINHDVESCAVGPAMLPDMLTVLSFRKRAKQRRGALMLANPNIEKGLGQKALAAISVLRHHRIVYRQKAEGFAVENNHRYRIIVEQELE
jgi:hypothetical protein